MAFRSLSVAFAKACQGIGGNNIRPLSMPLNFPSRMAFINCASLHVPMPLSSDVRLAENDTPHGPAQAVCIGLKSTQDLKVVVSMGPIGMAEGWPDNSRFVSGTGPCGVIIFGEWQSLQPMMSTRYLPLVARSSLVVIFSGSTFVAVVCESLQAIANTADKTAAGKYSFLMMFVCCVIK